MTEHQKQTIFEVVIDYLNKHINQSISRHDIVYAVQRSMWMTHSARPYYTIRNYLTLLQAAGYITLDSIKTCYVLKEIPKQGVFEFKFEARQHSKS